VRCADQTVPRLRASFNGSATPVSARFAATHLTELPVLAARRPAATGPTANPQNMCIQPRRLSSNRSSRSRRRPRRGEQLFPTTLVAPHVRCSCQ
jgi:hypothetical protein